MEIVVLIFLVLAAIQFVRARDEKKLSRSAEPIIAATILAHKRALFIQVEQQKVVDPYGNVDYPKLQEQIVYFITNVVARDCKKAGIPDKYFTDKQRVEKIFKAVGLAVAEEMEQSDDGDLSLVKTGIDYELFCKRLLETAGWSVLTTPATGDQGADLIATKSNVRVIFQCKYYGQPVGNKAVQEAYAAKAHQKADFAIVVTNAKYTTSAEQLAQSSGVFLIHHKQIPTLQELLGEQYFQSLQQVAANNPVTGR